MSVGESINVTGPCFIRSAGNAACVSHIAHGTGKSSRPSPRRVLRRNSVNALITIIKKNFIQHPEFPSPAAVGSNSCSWCSCVGLLRCRAWRVYERKYEGGGTNGVENGRRKEREREGERERERSSWYVCTWTAIVLHCGGIDSAGGGTPHLHLQAPIYTPAAHSPSLSHSRGISIGSFVSLPIHPLFFHPCPLASSWSCCILSDFSPPLFSSLSLPCYFFITEKRELSVQINIWCNDDSMTFDYQKLIRSRMLFFLLFLSGKDVVLCVWIFFNASLLGKIDRFCRWKL